MTCALCNSSESSQSPKCAALHPDLVKHIDRGNSEIFSCISATEHSLDTIFDNLNGKNEGFVLQSQDELGIMLNIKFLNRVDVRKIMIQISPDFDDEDLAIDLFSNSAISLTDIDRHEADDRLIREAGSHNLKKMMLKIFKFQNVTQISAYLRLRNPDANKSIHLQYFGLEGIMKEAKQGRLEDLKYEVHPSSQAEVNIDNVVQIF
ncbi:MAG: hypothetical protein MHMPM18_002261 [Marteilia pararefringens]